MDLFSFGTLMDTELLSAVTGISACDIVSEEATVHNRVALWVKDDHYPVLLPREGSITHGLIIRNLTADAFDRIVFFEGGEFRLEELEVVTANGKREHVQYFADNEIKPVSDYQWCLKDWQQSTKMDTMPRVSRYMQCYGQMSVDEADAFW